MTEKDWKELRVKYFDECTYKTELGTINIKKVHPRVLFEWFKKEINGREIFYHTSD